MILDPAKHATVLETAPDDPTTNTVQHGAIRWQAVSSPATRTGTTERLPSSMPSDI